MKTLRFFIDQLTPLTHCSSKRDTFTGANPFTGAPDDLWVHPARNLIVIKSDQFYGDLVDFRAAYAPQLEVGSDNPGFHEPYKETIQAKIRSLDQKIRPAIQAFQELNFNCENESSTIKNLKSERMSISLAFEVGPKHPAYIHPDLGDNVVARIQWSEEISHSACEVEINATVESIINELLFDLTEIDLLNITKMDFKAMPQYEYVHRTMKMVPKEQIEIYEIKELISYFTPLKQISPVAYSGPCIFHKDLDNSLRVNTQKQIFKCIQCGEGGSAKSFKIKMRRLIRQSL